MGNPVPRITAPGMHSSASPMTSSPAEARLSATARCVTSSFLPNRSLLPRSSSTALIPAHPMATPLHPRRIACVLLSAIITPILTLYWTSMAFLMARALRSGSAGRGVTDPSGAFDASTPALGSRVPFFMHKRKPGIPPTTESVSCSTTSTTRGSIRYCVASFSAQADGVMVESGMIFPSAVATAVSASTRMSPSLKPPQECCAAAIMKSTMESPLLIKPVGSPVTVNELFMGFFHMLVYPDYIPGFCHIMCTDDRCTLLQQEHC